MILAHARLLFPDRMVPGWVRLVDGHIAEIGPGECPHEGSSSEVMDLGGDFLGPGLVDEHVHGAVGHDFMEATEAAFGRILGHHAAGGTTALLPTSVSAPWSETLRFLDVVEDWRQHPRPGLPTVLGAHVEGPFLNPGRAGAQNIAHLCLPSRAHVQDLLDRAGTVRIVTLAPELPGAGEAIARLTAGGIRVSLGHSEAWDEDVQRAFAAGADRVTHLYNAMSSARRRGPERVAGLLECALAAAEVQAEIIADGHHVSHTLLQLALRAKVPDALRLVSDATAGCGLPEGTPFHLGGRACVAGAGVGMLVDDSALAGSTIRLIDAVRLLVRAHSLPLWEAVRLASPATGLVMGAPADLLRLQADLEVGDVWIRGERMDLPAP